MTKKYKITVDGTAYTVEVEDLGAGAPAAACASRGPTPPVVKRFGAGGSARLLLPHPLLRS